MKKFLFTAVVIISTAICLCNFTSAEENFSMTDEGQLKNLYREMWQALVAKDIKKLDAIHDENFFLVHMTGMKQPKADYLECVRDGRLNYFSVREENIFVEVSGDSGKMIGQSKVEAAVFGGRKNVWRLQLAFEVKKISGNWILMNGRASTY